MDRIMLAAAIGMGLVFVTGVTVGVVLMVAMAIRREDRRNTRIQRRLNRVGLLTITPRDAEDVRR